jgi:nitrite reductase (NO-forming)
MLGKPLAATSMFLGLALVGTATYTLAKPDGIKMVYGAPEAVVSNTAYKGAYVEGGSAVTVPPEIKPVPNTKTHHVRLDLTHKTVEIDDGVMFEGWTFGDTIPGPTVHVREGDKVVFTMTNRSGDDATVTFPMPHSIDFHAAMVNPLDKYRTIGAGQTLTFEWTANYPGVFMYHCGTPMLLHHMVMGMYGTVVVDPKEGWPDKVDREYVVVQSEFYTKPKDPKNPNLLVSDVESALKKSPSHVTLNGRIGRHVKDPLKAKPGDRVRLYVMNVGPTDTSSFHVVGTLFDKVYMDGNPKNVQRGLQTILLGSSNGAVVEFVVPEAGKYAMLDHEFADASLGALGFIDASEGKGPATPTAH